MGGLVTTAIFYGFAPFPYLMIGGGSMGLGAGVWAHLVQAYQAGEDVRPEGMVRYFPSTLFFDSRVRIGI
jgi:hypothetical protein